MSLDAIALEAKLGQANGADLIDVLLPYLLPDARRRAPDAITEEELAVAVAGGVWRAVKLWDGCTPFAPLAVYHSRAAVDTATITAALN